MEEDQYDDECKKEMEIKKELRIKMIDERTKVNRRKF